MADTFKHKALELRDTDRPLVYTAMSKHLFYFREHISKFVLQQGGVPLNPFMTFNYFMLDTVDRDVVRQANNTLVARADQLWMFGPISDGALAEIIQAKEQGKIVRYFGVVDSREIVEYSKSDAEMEPEVEGKRAFLWYALV